METDRPDPGLYPPDRLGLAAAAARDAGLAALLLTPGPDLRYLTGYDAHQLERLTCLAIPAAPAGRRRPRPGAVPGRAEAGAARGPGVARGRPRPGDRPVGRDRRPLRARRRAARDAARGTAGSVGLSDRMWALMVLRFRAALPGVRQELASAALRALRVRKTPAEVAALRAAGEAIDRVHARVPGWLRAGRTERAGRRRHRGRDPRRRDTPGSTSRSSAPARTRPARTTRSPTGCCGRRRRGRRHRRHHAERLLLGLHPDLRDRRAAGGLRRLLPGAEGRAGGGVRRGPAGRDRRGRRRRRPRADHRGRLRRVLRAPDRPRHRPGDATRIRTSCPATPSRCSRASRSRSSPASTRARTAPGSRTSSCAPSSGCERLNNATRELVCGGRPVMCRPSSARRRRRRDPRAVRADRELADAELRPRVAAAERDGPFPRDEFRILGRSGLLACRIPSELGGGGQPYETYLQVVEELAGAWLAVGLGVSVHTLTCFPLVTAGTPEQRAALAARHARRRPARGLLPVGAGQRLGRRRAADPRRGGRRRLRRERGQGVDLARRAGRLLHAVRAHLRRP